MSPEARVCLAYALICKKGARMRRSKHGAEEGDELRQQMKG